VIVEARAHHLTTTHQATYPALLAENRLSVAARLAGLQPRGHDPHSDAVERLTGRVAALEARSARRRRLLAAAVEPSERRRDPDRPERIRRDLARIDNDLAVTRAELATQQLWQQAPLTGAANNLARIELDVIDTMIHKQAAANLQPPARYLLTVLGNRPDTSVPDPDDHAGRLWDDAAIAIETYRVGQLGLSPEAGPLPGSGPQAAIGLRPHADWAKAAHWDHTLTAITHLREHRHPGIEPTRIAQ
jgi:hypothetical protein